MIRIIILTILLAGCSAPPLSQVRVVCDNGFETPWSVNAFVTDGAAVKWYEYWSDPTHYKIPEGVKCHKERRTAP